MRDPEVVRDRQRAERLREEVDDARARERPLRCNQVPQVLPVQELHRDVEQPVVVLAVVEDADRVRVVEARGRLRLAVEARREHRVARQLPVHHLDGDDLLERGLPCAVDGPHRAGAELLLEQKLLPNVPPDQRVGRLLPVARLAALRKAACVHHHVARLLLPRQGRARNDARAHAAGCHCAIGIGGAWEICLRSRPAGYW